MYNRNQDRTPAVWTKISSANNLTVSFSEKGGVKLSRTTLQGKEQLICFIKGADLELFVNGAEAIAIAIEKYNESSKTREADKALQYAKEQVRKVSEQNIKVLQSQIDALKMSGHGDDSILIQTLNTTIMTLKATAA